MLENLKNFQVLCLKNIMERIKEVYMSAQILYNNESEKN